VVAAAIAVAGVVLALVFLPGRATTPTATKAPSAASQDEIAVGG